MDTSIASIIEMLISGKSLSEEESFLTMKAIFSGGIPPAQIAAFLTAMRAKGESVDEIVGFVKMMRESMVKISTSAPVVVDTCGTGGDGKGTFNISTAAAFVVAGAGVPVAKHGNRSISSKCGSADVLESAGVKVDMSRETAENCLNEIGITFLFAPLYHPAMKVVGPVRKEMGIRTIFNILGPLLNPAGANVQIIGVPRKEFQTVIANVLRKIGSDKKNAKEYTAMVIHESGYDEMVLSGKCTVIEVARNKSKTYTLTPAQVGMKKTNPGILKGGTSQENAQILREILSGKNHPLRDVVVANAGLALFCAGKALKKGLSLKGAIQTASDSIESSGALSKLNALVELSNRP